jgi:hypothetical protein
LKRNEFKLITGGVSVVTIVAIIHLDANVAVASADSSSNANNGKDEDLKCKKNNFT